MSHHYKRFFFWPTFHKVISKRNGLVETSTPYTCRFFEVFGPAFQEVTSKRCWLVVWNIFYFHPYLGKIPNLTSIFKMDWNHQLGWALGETSTPDVSVSKPEAPWATQHDAGSNCRTWSTTNGSDLAGWFNCFEYLPAGVFFSCSDPPRKNYPENRIKSPRRSARLCPSLFMGIFRGDVIPAKGHSVRFGCY